MAATYATPGALDAQVLPSGANVVNGAASIQQGGSRLTVTNTPGAIIQWQSFSIGAGATAQFVQQNAASTVYNRVVGSDPSSILGQLQSNGRVFLINPNGITIGAGAQIDAAAFVASTLGVSNADLLAGRLRFEATPGSANVVNHGTIVTQSGGFVYFIGKNVENHGVIHTPKGEILLAAGNAVEIFNPRTPALRVEVSAGAEEAVNLGRLIAAGGTIGMFAGNVRQRGVVSATTAEVNAQGRVVLRAKRDVEIAAGSRTEASGPAGGSVTLQAESGTLTLAGQIEARGTATPATEPALPVSNPALAYSTRLKVAPSAPADANGVSVEAGVARPVRLTAAPAAGNASVSAAAPALAAASAPGGRIEATAPVIAVADGALLDVSGESGGGTILVGGDYQGANPLVANARLTTVAAGAVMRADALLAGSGGRVIVWADEATDFRGTISARGGAGGGDGGFAEVSGKQMLYFSPRRSIDLRAPLGAAGTLLLDPANVSIIDGPGEDLTTGSFSSGSFGGATGTATIRWATIETQLGTSNVVITTSGTGGSGDITVTNGYSYSSANSLTLNADRNIVITATASAGGLNVAGVTNTGTGAINLNAAVTVATGSVTSVATGSISTAATSGTGIAITAGTGGVSLAAGLNSGGGTLSINGGGGAVATAGLTTTNATTSAIQISSASTLSLGAASTGSGGRITLTHSGAGSQTGAISGGGTEVVKQGAGTLVLSQANTFGGGLTVNAGTVQLGGLSVLATTGAVTLADVAGVTFNLNGNNATIGTLSGGGVAGGLVTSGSAATLTVGAAANSSYNGIVGGALSLVKQGAGTLTFGAANTYTGGTTVNAGTLTLGVANALAASGAVTVNGGALGISSFNQAVGVVTLTGGSITGTSGILTGASYGVQAGSISAILGGAGALTKTTAGTVTLSGANTYSGGTNV
ncbi:MAG: filamentous hemagglutinin N-terminal domain-containing protein, partial [Burkholderiales bacterium]|nr:filamentous hemagglutinin N-terminal domain-containing protein [Burkholderiales bacterium]